MELTTLLWLSGHTCYDCRTMTDELKDRMFSLVVKLQEEIMHAKGFYQTMPEFVQTLERLDSHLEEILHVLESD